jgi:hypothetical protein
VHVYAIIYHYTLLFTMNDTPCPLVNQGME